MPAPQHNRQSMASVSVAILTISDTRTESDDRSGALIRELLAAAGHREHSYAIVKDEADVIRERFANLVGDPECDAILCTGGTGVARRDVTADVAERLITKRLDGFGELFRMRSYEEIGAAAMLSRAVGGLVDDTVLFVMPGSTAAVRLAMEQLILPEIGHLVYLVRGA